MAPGVLHRCFCLLFVLGASAAQALDPATRIDVSPPAPDAGTAIRISIEGHWPDACTPTLQSARIRGNDIVLHTTLAAANCAGAARTFRIDTRKLPPQDLKLRANGFYRLRFEVQRGEGTPELHAFRLLYVGNDADSAPRPETGFWWPESGGDFDQAGPGLGMQLETQARTLSLGVYGYDADGDSHWLFGAGDLTGHVAQVDLSRLERGAGPFDEYRAPEAMTSVGQVHLEVLSPSRANAWFVRPVPQGRGLEAQPISMVRFRFAQQPAEAWLGAWVVLAESVEAMPARRVDFTILENTDDGFVLRDASHEHDLRCTLQKARRNSPPQSCILGIGNGAARSEIDFSQVALNEMRGWNSDSQHIIAVKLVR